jgi:diadenosine tetraphosphate (Ap4A) HIT family hydrolase
MNDANYPWVILVPRRAGMTEIYQLDEEDQKQLLHESSFVSKVLHDNFIADKINVASLGNMVPQLHLHHVVRYKTDKTWPHAVWGKVCRQAYSEEALQQILRKLREALHSELL